MERQITGFFVHVCYEQKERGILKCAPCILMMGGPGWALQSALEDTAPTRYAFRAGRTLQAALLDRDWWEGREDPGLRLQRSIADSVRLTVDVSALGDGSTETSVGAQGPVCSSAPGGTRSHSCQHSAWRQQSTKLNSRLQTTTRGTVCHTWDGDSRSIPCPTWGSFF